MTNSAGEAAGGAGPAGPAEPTGTTGTAAGGGPTARPPALPAWAGLLLALGALLPAVLGGLLFHRQAPRVPDVALQLAGSRTAAEAVVGGRVADHLAALRADLWLVSGYGLSLVAAALLGGYVLGPVRRRLPWGVLSFSLTLISVIALWPVLP
ncbi:hypothetical protein ABZW03_09455, partial [Kitasatospora sp. NPDC004799]